MFPIRDSIPSKHFPVMNWLIILANTIVFLYTLQLDEIHFSGFIQRFGLIPARIDHIDLANILGIHIDNYFPFITNIFLHGGWLHFIFNMWTLFIFGDNVEDRMGPFRYLAFYLLCGLGASLSHYLLYMHSPVAAIGASGAISGIMGAYMFLFPFSRITLLFPLFFVPIFFEIHAMYYIAFWFIVQLLNAIFDLDASTQSSSIAFWAHIGGFLTGAALFIVFVKKKKRTLVSLS